MYGRANNNMLGPKEIDNISFEKWIKEEGEDKLKDSFGNKGDFGLVVSSTEEKEKVVFVSDDEESVMEELQRKINADKKLVNRYKAKPTPSVLRDVAYPEMSIQDKIKWLIFDRGNRKKIAPNKGQRSNNKR